MATLADLRQDQQFLFACQVTSLDDNGLGLSLYGPGRVQAATALIAPTGVMTGTLSAPPDQVPVTIVTGFVPISVGDVLENSVTGETVVCRWSQINTDGTVAWSSALSHTVVYSATGWQVTGHVSI